MHIRCVASVSWKQHASAFLEWFYSCKVFMLVQVVPDYTFLSLNHGHKQHKTMASIKLFGFQFKTTNKNLSCDPCDHLCNYMFGYLSSYSGSLLGPSTSFHKSQAYAHGWGEEGPCHLPRATRWGGPHSSFTTQFKQHHDIRDSKLPEPKALSSPR